MTAPRHDFLSALAQDIIGPLVHTGQEVAEISGMAIDDAERLWVELGFPPTDRHVRSFTDDDVEILRNLRFLQESGLVDIDDIIGMTRVLGQALARVATAQAQLTGGGLDLTAEGDGPPKKAVEDEIRARVALTLPMNELFITYVWRRHLAASLRRRFDPRESEVVGFADLVGYTRLSSHMRQDELPELLASFQQTANLQVATNGGRVLKVIGDAVMFVAPEPEAAAWAALGIEKTLSLDESMPPVRIGMSMGVLVSVEGDVYGDTVNRASRLAELARPDTVLVDDAMGNSLFDCAGISVHPLRPRKVKGLGLVRAWSVRRASSSTP